MTDNDFIKMAIDCGCSVVGGQGFQNQTVFFGQISQLQELAYKIAALEREQCVNSISKSARECVKDGCELNEIIEKIKKSDFP